MAFGTIRQQRSRTQLRQYEPSRPPRASPIGWVAAGRVSAALVFACWTPAKGTILRRGMWAQGHRPGQSLSATLKRSAVEPKGCCHDGTCCETTCKKRFVFDHELGIAAAGWADRGIEYLDDGRRSHGSHEA